MFKIKPKRDKCFVYLMPNKNIYHKKALLCRMLCDNCKKIKIEVPLIMYRKKNNKYFVCGTCYTEANLNYFGNFNALILQTEEQYNREMINLAYR